MDTEIMQPGGHQKNKNNKTQNKNNKQTKDPDRNKHFSFQLMFSAPTKEKGEQYSSSYQCCTASLSVLFLPLPGWKNTLFSQKSNEKKLHLVLRQTVFTCPSIPCVGGTATVQQFNQIYFKCILYTYINMKILVHNISNTLEQTE